MFGDQYLNAARVQDAGIGLHLKTFSFAPRDLQEAVEKLRYEKSTNNLQNRI